MSTTTSINITTIRDNEKKQKSITYINPLTSSQELIDFAQSIVAVTNDSYDKTTRIDRIDCDEVTARPITSKKFQTQAFNAQNEATINASILTKSGNSLLGGFSLGTTSLCLAWYKNHQVVGFPDVDVYVPLVNFSVTRPNNTCEIQFVFRKADFDTLEIGDSVTFTFTAYIQADSQFDYWEEDFTVTIIKDE